MSVAMATYNGERFLEEQLASLAGQTHLPAELVICDDGSTDRTADIVEAFARSAPFAVRFVRNESRLGYAENFLQAARLCHGETIAFCDQDDVWLPRKLEVCARRLAEPEVLAVVHDARIVDAALRPSGRFLRTGRKPWVRRARFPDTGTQWGQGTQGFRIVFHRAILPAPDVGRPPDANAPDQPMTHDEWVHWRALWLGTVVFLREPLALYRQHEANVAGAPRTLTVGRLARGALTSDYRQQAQLARQYVDYLAGPGGEFPAAAFAIRFYQELARMLDHRAAVYEAMAAGQSRWQAIARFLGLALRGAYLRTSRPRFGLVALAKDLIFASLGQGAIERAASDQARATR